MRWARLKRFLAEFLSDAVWYLAVPVSAQLLPVSLAERYLGFFSARSWCLSSFTRNALLEAQKHVEITDTQAWSRRFKQVRLGEAYDLFYYQLRRGKALSRFSKPIGEVEWPHCIVGLHYGVGLSILKLVNETGGRPRIIRRKISDGFWRVRPGFYLYQRVMTRYIERCCYGRSIEVPGGVKEISSIQEGETLVMLCDVPSESVRNQACLALNQSEINIATGGIRLVTRKHFDFSWYAVKIGASTLDRRLDLSHSIQNPDLKTIVMQIESQLNELVSQDSAQWQMWPYFEQYHS